MTRLERVSIWLAFGMLAASATLAFWTTGAQIENARWVEHTLQVMETLDVASGHVTTMQNSRRGFALTGDEDELLSFTSATTGLGSAATRLRSLTSDNPIQQVRLDRLDPLLARAEQLETESIASRRADGFVPDREAASARNVSAVVHAVTALLADLNGEERVLLVRREQSMATSVRIARIAHVAGTAVGLVVILLAFLGLRRGNERLVQSELAARQGEQDLYTTLNSIGDGVISTNATGHVVRLNRVAEALTGWGQAALGKPLAEVFRVIDGRTRLACESPFAEVLRLDSPFTWSNHKLLLREHGEPHPVADSAAPIRDAAGEITGVVLVFHDVTKERAAEVILRESEALLRESAGRKKADDRFRALVESGPDAMVIFDDGGQIVLVNAPAEALFGYRRDELLGRGIDMLVPKGDSIPDLRSEPGYFSGLNAQMSASRVERCGKRKDGTDLPIEITMSRLTTDDGP
ncbi:MAG: PAS domain S-box protein, partial [Polyangiaceae bacterium]